MQVLLTTDGSACAAHAAREALRLLPLREATVHVLHHDDGAVMVVRPEAP